MPLPASNSLNSLIINSDGIRAERSILFVARTWTLQHWLKNEGGGFVKSRAERMENTMYCNPTLQVGFIKFSLFTHSQAYCKRTHTKLCIITHNDMKKTQQKQSYTCYKHPFLSLFSLGPSLWWDRGCHAVTVRSRRTNKCFPLRRCDLNGKATWQLCSERPHNQTPRHSYTPPLLFRRLSTLRFMHVKYTA